MKYGTILQLQNIARWLQNYFETGNRLCDITKNTSKERFMKNEIKLRADTFNPPDKDKLKKLIDDIQTILQNYKSQSLEDIQQEWNVIRPRLTRIFHEGRVLPEIIYPQAIVEKTPDNERVDLLSYLVCKLEKIEGAEDLVIRLNEGDDSAYSEAILATYFLQMGLEVRLEPVIEMGKKNDISVRVNSEWINIEVKTPQKSQLQEEMLNILDELFNFVHKLPVSRDVYVFLTKEPSIKEQKEISNKILELASCKNQPVIDKVKDIAVIRTEDLSFKPRFVTPTSMIGRLNVRLPFPSSLIESHNTLPMLFLSSSKFDTREDGVNVNFTLYAPFEDARIIAMIKKKRKQLSRNSMNMIAFDTTHIPITPNLKKQYSWEKRLREGLKTKVSRRIGAVLLFSRFSYRERISFKSSLFVHSNPYKSLPLNFLNKCDLNSYELTSKQKTDSLNTT